MAPEATSFDEDIDYYDFLSIEATATDAEIQRAYRRTNLKYHPDKFKPTPELNLEQAAAKLDLLQKILTVLKDPAKRADYDRGREAKRRQDAIAKQMASARKRMKVELDEREKKASIQVNGVKRKYNEHERTVQGFQAANKGLKEAMEKQRHEERARQQEAAETHTRSDAQSEPEAKDRSVKITWTKEGNGLDIDEAALKEMCGDVGPVESVGLLDDKKRRVDGQKTVVGRALVVFTSPSGAQEAVRRGPWDGVTSVTWAFKGTHAG
jgi:DnaJ homolog subfamily C member 17